MTVQCNADIQKAWQVRFKWSAVACVADGQLLERLLHMRPAWPRLFRESE